MDSSLSSSASAGNMAAKMNIASPTSVLAGTAGASPLVGRTTPSPSSSASSNPPLLPASAPTTPSLNSEVDPQIIEALRSKDRIYVLKLGEQFEGLIKERRTRVELTPATSYQRLLVHRCSAYYKLQPESDPVTKALYVVPTSESKIPERRICELVPAESNSHPSFKIMKRAPDRRKPHSHAGSIAGEDADLSDVEPSEAGSLGGQSSITSGSTKKRMTIEQREAAYNEARSRIFMGFEEKEKIKDKDMSASSSSLSVSGSTSTSAGGRSSAGDTDDMVSSPATESEWSTPSGTFVRDKRRGGGSGGASSSRSLRSGGSFRGDGSGSSSRNSRAASPSFSYATLYEPPPSAHAYDGPQHPVPPNMAYHHSPQYGYQYPSPNSGPNPSFVPTYPYYTNSPIPYQSPPPMQHNPSDPSLASGLDPYSPPHQMNYGQPYGWPHLQSPQHPMHMSMPPPAQHQQQPQQHLPQQNGVHSMGPMSPPSHLPPGPPTHTPPYSPYGIAPQHAYSYPMNQYYPPGAVLSPAGQPGQHPTAPQAMASPPLLHPGMGMHPHQQMQSNPQSYPSYDIARSMNPNQMGHISQSDFNSHQPNQFGQNQVGASGPRGGLGNGVLTAGNNSVNGRPIPARDGSNSSGGKRNMQPMPTPANTRSAWSYGPGVSLGGFPTGLAASGGGAFGGGGGGNDSVGPRFNNSNNSNRRTSGHTNSGGNSRASSNCDDVSSIASSSTTSSSSRRTYTSTTSSQQQHPLPPRPDWAVGMKAQPTLASRHHDQHSLSNSRTLSPISPPRSGDQSLPVNSISSGSSGNAADPNSPRHPASAGFVAPSSLQAVDFPPLTTAGPQEKRGPVATGAWGASRPILSPTLNGNSVGPSSVTTSPGVPQSPRSGAGEDGKGFEMYTPKLVRRTAPNTTNPQPPLPRSPAANPVALVGQVASMSLTDTDVDGSTSASQSSSRVAPSTLA
ncbi:hypothetical protein CPB83DRAFT_859653 [Crepidotus variabilis]|uniref:SUZ domain-containing protein n=1 Tax=Crepidotus variabilis TaxID=179855 RepID=A0A9P6EA69_9AGAR|nr:hypothetical protein CPB83DRAFT_859653 [Crepidotus variabilis]